MSDDKPDRKEMLRRAGRALPPAIIGYGLGYGIARTMLEGYLKKNPGAMPSVRKYAPLALGAGAAYAGSRVSAELWRQIQGEKKA